MNDINTKLWTSELKIEFKDNYSVRLCLPIVDNLINSFKKEEKLYSKFIGKFTKVNPGSRLYKYLKYDNITNDELKSFINYSDKPDVTGLMKGYALSVLRSELLNVVNKFLINFGGDIVASNWNKVDLWIDSELNNHTSSIIRFHPGIILSGNFCVFTSSNKSKRGYHIKNINNEYKTVTICKNNYLDLIRMDMYATQLVADKVTIDKPNCEIIYS